MERNGIVLFDTAQHGNGLAEALKKSRQEIIMEVRESGLKGRGGAGFPTGTKWMLAAAALADAKYVVCNADEGEPGTFKDRVLLDEYPELVFEGMAIGGYAIGSRLGFLYLRGEYRYLLAKLEAVLAGMRADGRLGNNVCGKADFTFDIQIRLGSGAYVCGEETALIESLEGHRGEARNRPPFPVNTGYMGCPTTVNNVETFASVAVIMSKGAEWYKKIGTDKSTGSKLLSISGDCEKPGVYEVPFGMTITELLAMVGAKDTKAVQVGGASGTCLPKSDFGRKVAFEDISTGGSVIIFNESRDMLHVLKNFMEFFVEESCGQCTPCRIGNIKLLEGVEKIEKGECSIAYLNELMQLGQSMQVASKCGLGQSSPSPFLSIMTHFQHEIFSQR
jgi:[NiFe] hydrogenase diaphorase moiety large subunit